MITTIAVILVFGILVLVHELGHFVFAKLTGMCVDEFAIGFGKKIWGRKYGETLYSIRMIPLGGYNKIAGMERDMDTDSGDRAFWAKPIWARMIVILAGSMMNFILPIFIFAGIFSFHGIATPNNSPFLGDVRENSPAYVSGLRAGDKIISIDNHTINSWSEIVTSIEGADGRVLKVVYDRNGHVNSTSIIPEYNKELNKSIIGIVVGMDYHKLGIIDSFKYAINHSIDLVGRMYHGLYQMITGQVSGEISGPVGVAQMTGQAAQMGLIPLLQFAAFLSLNLAIINLLPVPALDGGHFILLLLEAIRRKPIPTKYAHFVQMVGVVLLFSLMLYATAHDIIRLFN